MPKSPVFFTTGCDRENGYLEVQDEPFPRTPAKMRKGASQDIFLIGEKL
jgi:hypothetical protein